MVLPYAGKTAPAGFLLCDGSELSRTQYSTLFAAIGTTWGSTSGDTFTIPDLRGRLIAGCDRMNAQDRGTGSSGNAAGRLHGVRPANEFGNSDGTLISGAVDGTDIGNYGGEQGHSLGDSEIPSHNHFGGKYNNGAGVQTPIGAVDTASTSSDVPAHPAGSELSHSNVQPSIYIMYMIKT